MGNDGRTPNDIFAWWRGPLAEHGSGALATEDAWALRYSIDVGILLDALRSAGVDVTPTPPTRSEPGVERWPWEVWEERLGHHVYSCQAVGIFAGRLPLTREEYIDGYLRCEVDPSLPGHRAMEKEKEFEAHRAKAT